MILVSSPNIPEKKIVKTLGLVKGNTIRARHIGKDIIAGLRAVVGGELHEYTQLLAQSREQAIDRMIEDAEKMGANAIVSVSFTTSVMSQGSAELMAFGTAVLIEDH
jgi:uncharacterized protein YbjQ (UPF0145 family)|tara:strand:- start:687 stop:1007 length:321 start_codon:yes stop_codon:yes gene_type:complete